MLGFLALRVVDSKPDVFQRAGHLTVERDLPRIALGLWCEVTEARKTTIL